MSGAVGSINTYIEEILHARYGEQVRNAIVNALQWDNSMTATVDMLPAGSTPTVNIDRSGNNPVLQLGLPYPETDVATTSETQQIIDEWSNN